MLSFLIPVVQLFEVVIAAVASVVFFVFAGITLGASLVGLAIVTPLFVIFSPILVPATITTTLLAGGVLGAVALGATASALILWLLKHRIGVKPKNNPAPKGAPTKADKPGEMSGDKAGGASGDKPGGAPGDKPGGAPGGASGGEPGDKLEGAPGGALGGASGGASGGAPGDKPGGAQGGAPGGASGGAPGDKPAGAPGHKLLAWW